MGRGDAAGCGRSSRGRLRGSGGSSGRGLRDRNDFCGDVDNLIDGLAAGVESVKVRLRICHLLRFDVNRVGLLLGLLDVGGSVGGDLLGLLGLGVDLLNLSGLLGGLLGKPLCFRQLGGSFGCGLGRGSLGGLLFGGSGSGSGLLLLSVQLGALGHELRVRGSPIRTLLQDRGASGLGGLGLGNVGGAKPREVERGFVERNHVQAAKRIGQRRVTAEPNGLSGVEATETRVKLVPLVQVVSHVLAERANPSAATASGVCRSKRLADELPGSIRAELHRRFNKPLDLGVRASRNRAGACA